MRIQTMSVIRMENEAVGNLIEMVFNALKHHKEHEKYTKTHQLKVENNQSIEETTESKNNTKAKADRVARTRAVKNAIISPFGKYL